MYFVTTKGDGYVLFCMTPSERAAVGLTEKNVVRLLVRGSSDAAWRVLREWDGNVYSHTDFMAAMHYREEPASPEQLADLLPPGLRS